MTKIGFICDSPLLPTGYAKVARNLAIELQKLGNEISFCPMQYMGMPVDLGYGTIYEGDELRSVQRYLDSVRPDAVINLRDSFVLSQKYGYNTGGGSYLLPHWCHERNIKFISYSPVHSAPLSLEEIKVAHEVDYNLTMSSWGRDLMAIQGLPHGKVDYLYHGVDTAIYHPLSAVERQKCREELGFPVDKKIVGSVAMNYDYRKMLPLTMKAFQIMLKSVPDAHLVLWTEPVAFWDLEQWAINLNIRDKVSFANTTKSWGMSEQFMTKLYNCFDLYVNTATSEGFGLPILEALACGVPCVIPDYPVLREIFGHSSFNFSSAVSFASAQKIFPITMGAFEWLVDVEWFAKIMAAELLTKKQKQKPDAAYDAVSFYSWKRAAVKLDSILDDLLTRKWISNTTVTDGQLASSMEHESFLRDDLLTTDRMPLIHSTNKTTAEDPTVFYDVGAHAGRWSIRAAKYYDHVVAVEPIPATLQALLENIALNHCKNVDVRAVALTNNERVTENNGLIQIIRYEKDGWNSVHVRPDDKQIEKQDCICTTLDNLVAVTSKIPTTVKIDVEGHEREVLEGGKNILSQHHPRLVIEVHSDEFIAQIESRLQEYGYSRFRKQKDSWHAQTCTYMIAEK